MKVIGDKWTLGEELEKKSWSGWTKYAWKNG